MTMVERVARAMYTATMPNGGESYEGFDADLDWEINRDTYRQLARAAIQAMMEHDEAMINAMIVELSDSTVPDPKARAWDALRAYKAGLRAALDEKR